MSKQQAMEYLFNYLTDHSSSYQPGVRSIRVTGDGDVGWCVEIARDRGKTQEGRGADFAEALDNASGQEAW